MIVSIDGHVVECVDSYRYLGTEPTDIETAFKRRHGLAWGAIRRLDQLSRSRGVAALPLKLKFFNALILSIFVYACQTWPATRAWIRRIDSAYDRMLRYCFGPAFNRLALHRNGVMPLLSTIVTHRRANTVGHALRRDQALSRVLKCEPWRIGRALGLERTIAREVESMIDPNRAELRSNWGVHAADRDYWRARARNLAMRHEDTEYDRLQAQHDRRTAHPLRQERVAPSCLLGKAPPVSSATEGADRRARQRVRPEGAKGPCRSI